MIGSISMWLGAVNAVPAGWVLCDGTAGTPDLRDKFVVGSGTLYALNTTGGSNGVTLDTSQIAAHLHASGGGSTTTAGVHEHSLSARRSSGLSAFLTIGSPGTTVLNNSGFLSTGSSGSHTHSISGSTGSIGSAVAHENRPAYFALAFIMAVV